MVTFLSILIIIISVFLVIGLAMDEEDPSSFGSACRLCGGIPAAITLTTIGIVILTCKDDKPEAIDVYRGKTELQIEKKIVNNKVVSSDTIVVWKK